MSQLELKCGPWVDTWHDAIGGKSKVGGKEDKGNPLNQWEVDKWQVRTKRE